MYHYNDIESMLNGTKMVSLMVCVNKALGPVHTELLAKVLVLAVQKMDRISIVSDASLTLTLSLRAQCEQALRLFVHHYNGM